MPLVISAVGFVRSQCLGHDHAMKKLKKANPKRIGRLYSVASVLTTLKPYKNYAQLVSASVDDGELFVGSDMALIDTFEKHVMARPDSAARAYNAQRSFTNALATSEGAYVYFYSLEDLRGKLLLWSGVTRYVITGDDKGLPQWDRFSPAFALVNSIPKALAVAA